jgi:heat-inducible transcriptional repressor
MDTAGRLSERKATILRALVSQYIRTGEPVGSEVLASASGLSVSSATIRNELAALEEMGYLTQPHTSAGRIPTDIGYRQFVDSLPARTRLRETERRAVISFFEEALADVDQILLGTTRLLSQLTRHASVALAPRRREAGIVRMELIGIGTASLVLVVLDTGQVDKRVIELPDDLSDEDAERLAAQVGDAVKGRTVTAAREEARRMAGASPAAEGRLFERIGGALDSIDSTAEAEHVLYGGVSNIAGELAFERRETLRNIFEALERETEILELLRTAAHDPPLRVTIGRESEVTGMWEASMVAAPYGGGQQLGTIGIVGPTRMDYGAAIAAVRAVADRLSAALEILSG